jgi:hypothetical protein
MIGLAIGSTILFCFWARIRATGGDGEIDFCRKVAQGAKDRSEYREAAGTIAESLPRGQLRKDQDQDYRDYKQRKEISLPGRPERAFGALTQAAHFQSPCWRWS